MNPVVESFGKIITLPENVGTIRKISATPQGEELIAYAARVSSKKQDKEDIKGLLTFCMKHGHVSIFEQASLTVEIQCPLAIAIQIIRHRSFCFQQFSQRYQDVEILEDFAYHPPTLRSQDTKNRQNSLKWQGGIAEELTLLDRMAEAYAYAQGVYQELLDAGVAKELARFVLPEGVMSKLYMTGNVRSWIFYLKTRTEEGVQHEHRILAQSIYDNIFKPEFPVIASMMDL